MKGFLQKIRDFLVSHFICGWDNHAWKDVGEPEETGTWSPYPAMGEVYQAQQCQNCHYWRRVWQGFVWVGIPEDKN